MPGEKYRSLKNPELYEKLRGQGKSKESAAKISNATRLGALHRRIAKEKD